MIKTIIFISAAIFCTVAASAQVTDARPTTAEQAILALPQTDSVMAQFSHFQLSRDVDGFHLFVTDETAIFVDLGFAGDMHVRIGF